jgi:spermidine synthase
MEYFKIDGKSYDVIITDLEENFNILYSENTGRTLAVGAPIVLSPLGTFYGHKVVVRRKKGFENVFDELYDIVSYPRTVSSETDGLHFEIAHNQKTISYYGYVSNGSRALKKIDEKTNKVYWGELQLNIVPIKAQVLPE